MGNLLEKMNNERPSFRERIISSGRRKSSSGYFDSQT